MDTKTGIFIYIIHSHDAFLKYYRTMIKSVENEKSLENKAFRGFCILYLMVKMAESIENKGFYRTQSKIALELIIEHRLISFHSFNQIQKSSYFFL